MFKYFRKQGGFTLIEMLIVLLVISVILLVTLPNVTKHNKNINGKGCDAYVQMLQGQVQAYQMEKKVYPQSFKELIDEGYLEKAEVKCPDGSEVKLVEGKVQAVKKTNNE